jgi:hypothetical protein
MRGVIETKRPETFNEYARTTMVVPASSNKEAIDTVGRRLELRGMETRYRISVASA